MKKTLYIISCMAVTLTMFSCGTEKIFLDLFSPEESGLNLVKITDEAAGSVIAFYRKTCFYGKLCHTTGWFQHGIKLPLVRSCKPFRFS